MDGKFTPYTHAPICATSPFEGICLPLLVLNLDLYLMHFQQESLNLYGQATININEKTRFVSGFVVRGPFLVILQTSLVCSLI